MIHYPYLITLFFFSFTASGCSEDPSSPKVLAPTALKINIINQKAGAIEVFASAQGGNFFNFYFGETENEVPLRSVDGKASHTYKTSGTYTLKVQAHTTSNVFITEEEEIVVALDNQGTIPTTGYTTPDNYNGMILMWQDEFEGDALNTDSWTFEIGKGSNGWGNNELQYYREENTAVQDGYLIITAKKETFEGSQYTSSRIITKDKQIFRYGRIDIRAALPEGQGVWPALWMLGANVDAVGWPACGELDIMEMIGGAGRENTVHGTVHWDNNGSYASYSNGHTLETGILGDEFHVFTIVWDASSITWYIDDVQFNVVDITPAELSEFRDDFFFIFNVAVGGHWPGNPDGSTQFPQQMVVDYVRVFQSQ